MNSYLEYIVEKILSVLQVNAEKENPGEIWKWIRSQSQEVEINTESLENMAGNKLVFGFFGITITPPDREAFYKLAEAVGARGIQNPEGAYNEQPVVNRVEISDTDLFFKIEEAMGFDVALPSFIGGKPGILTERGIITARHCYYLLLLKRIVDMFPDRSTRILEIGAGLGLLGYFLDQLGYKDYTIIDLARVNACQAYFLARNMPKREIVFSGDKDPFGKEERNSLKVLHTSDFENIPRGHFDLMINMDSFTEMDMDEAVNYMKSDCALNLLSVNHEQNNFRVIDICRQYRKLIYRYPFHVRPGYVEEMYQYKTSNT